MPKKLGFWRLQIFKFSLRFSEVGLVFDVLFRISEETPDFVWE